MIDVIEGFPHNVVACSAKGRVTKDDYLTTLIPEVERALAQNPKIRLYYELGPEFAGFDVGAAWEDAKVGIEHFSRWERVALVSDVQWIRYAVRAFALLMPAEVRVFDATDRDVARRWITEPVPAVATGSR